MPLESKILFGILFFHLEIKFNINYYSFLSLVISIEKFKTDYLELESWKKWYLSLVIDRPTSFNGKRLFNRIAKTKKVEYDDDIAVEVLTYRKTLRNFGGKICFKIKSLYLKT
jgi:hypothetical protein